MKNCGVRSRESAGLHDAEMRLEFAGNHEPSRLASPHSQKGELKNPTHARGRRGTTPSLQLLSNARRLLLFGLYSVTIATADIVL